jgi:alpha-L-rhamnosidase
MSVLAAALAVFSSLVRNPPKMRSVSQPARRLALASLTLLALIPSFTLATAEAAVTVGALRCEYLDEPQGIDVRTPRLSWILRSDERGQKQTAYQILVASTVEKLADDEGDLWDSGRVDSDDSIHVRYAGKPLMTHAACYWKVRSWDRDGAESAWSEPATWSMGILEPGDWKAEWIGLEGSTTPTYLAGTNWIWYPEGDPTKDAPEETRYFRTKFTVPADRKITKATLRFTADNRCHAWLNGRDLGSRDNHTSAKELDLTNRLQVGDNVLAVSATNDEHKDDQGKVSTADNPAAFVCWMEIKFDSGEPLTLVSDESWKSFNKESEGWSDAAFDDASWIAAKNLGPVGMQPWGNVRHAEDRRLPARYVRKEFDVAKPVRRAVVSFSGLGVSELYLNGSKVGDAVLSPAGTQYPKRVLYVTYDVTEQLKSGNNAIGVCLGNGRYYSMRSEVYASMPHYGFPKLLLHLRVEHEDGSVSTIVSDKSWKLTSDGPIVANNEYDGEEYDARKELGAWTTASYDDAHWQQAEAAIVPTGEIRAQMQEPMRVTETLKPLSVTERAPGVYVVDMGQNLVGWCRIRVRGKQGDAVKLVHAETLQSDGSLYLANIRGARVTDIYTLRGGAAVEEWEPRFTYHGFRFVEVTGWPGKLTVDDIDGRVVHDDLRSAGSFACSNPLLNQIYKNVVWGTRGNYRSFPTDCPQRDERQGWLGDRGEISRGEMYIYDNAAFYAKWVQDIADSTKENGSVPDVCPAYWPLYTDNVTWPSTTVLLPNSLYRQFGDADVIARHYDSAKLWVDYMLTFVKDGIIDRDKYGDWCVPPEDPKLIHSRDPARQTNTALLSTSYLYYDLRLMAKFATMLGKKQDAASFEAKAEELKAAFNAKFLNRELGQYDNGSQTSCVLPLAFGLVPDDMQEKVFARLVKKITEETNNHIGTGLIGGQFLCRVLTEGGRPDLAYTITAQTDYPSWGYMISQGATTVWELWNGNTADPAMNSGNHVMLVGDLVVWFYENLAGIKPDDANPGFKHIIMRPELVAGLDWVKATHNSPYGTIESNWKKDGNAFAWDIHVPVGAEASLYVPQVEGAKLTEGGKPLDGATGIEVLGEADGRTELRVGSGTYHFESK